MRRNSTLLATAVAARGERRRWGAIADAAYMLAVERGRVTSLLVSRHLGVSRKAARCAMASMVRRSRGLLRRVSAGVYAPGTACHLTVGQRLLRVAASSDRGLRRDQFVAATGISLGTVGKELRRLARAGKLSTSGNGIYRIAGDV